ncbi:hypothetical protein TSAR_000046 [Trichomalopsis sarcophagae]|uniref:Uncharacterized protein n=1 Tax=Trichomalopsis sarcophagae TaxID=543379 RepID=A0A232F318_9HYME|nr:hypothetical protein TSAR_000046 [Trichomalopsis sarcophagae]
MTSNSARNKTMKTTVLLMIIVKLKN